MRHSLRLLAAVIIVIATQNLDSAKAATGERVVLRAGEHANFSRVLFPLKKKRVWSFYQQGRNLVVRLKGTHATFDISAIFPRRAAHRVINATAKRVGPDTVFRFRLNCDCTGELYELDGAQLVLDISGSSETRATRSSRSTVKLEDSDQKTQAEAADRVRKRLVEQLQSAAKQGMVSFRKPSLPLSEPTPLLPEALTGSDSTPMPDVPAPPAAAGASPAEAMAGMKNDAMTQTASDAMTPESPQENAGMEPDFPAMDWSCRGDSEFDPVLWQNGSSAFGELGAMRSQLVSEFDRPNDMAVLTLARHYLAFELATEARALLRTFRPEPIEERGFLLELASLLDQKVVSPRGPILGPGPCKGRHGVLQALAHRSLMDHDTTVSTELQSGDSLQTLPRSWRSQIAAELALSAVESGRYDQAKRLFAIADRSAGAETPTISLIRGLIALHDDNDNEFVQAMHKLIGKLDDVATTAALRLAQHLVSKGEELSEELLLALDGVAIEKRHSPEGHEALALTAHGLLQKGQALQAAERVMSEKRFDRAEGKPLNELLSSLLDKATMESGKPESLALLLTVLPELSETPHLSALKIRVAQRLIASGLPETAAELMANEKSEKSRLLLAEALIESDRGVESLAVIRLLSDGQPKKALQARAEALQQSYRARAVDMDEATPESLAELAWLNGDWSRALKAYGDLERRGAGESTSDAQIRWAAAAFMNGDTGLAREVVDILQERSASAAALAASPPAPKGLVVERAEARQRHVTDLETALKELLGDG